MKLQSFLILIAAVGLITLINGLVYVTVQQNYRSNANDPQIQMALDIKEKLEQGKSPDSFWTYDSIALPQSLSPFVLLFDAAGKPIRASATLARQTLQLPSGVLDYTRMNGEDRITWQPREDARFAMVILNVPQNPVRFIAVGRSLREIEVREANLVRMVFISWVLCMSVLVAYGLLIFLLAKKKPNR